MGKLLNGGYGAIFGSYWMIYAAISSFASVFMLAKGYTNSEIGVTLAVANVLAVVIQPLIADFVDRSKKLGVLGTTEILTVVMMVFAVGLFVFKGGTMALCVVFVLLIGFHTALQPLFNSLAFRLEKAGVAMNFGVARAIGSLAYAIFIAILGVLVEKMGIAVVSVTTEITCLMLLGSLIFTGVYYRKAVDRNTVAGAIKTTAAGASKTTAAGETEDAEGGTARMEEVEDRQGQSAAQPEHSAAQPDQPEQEINLIQFIRRNKMFFIINIGVFGVYFSNAILNFFMAQIVNDVGGDTEDLGGILAVMAVLEMPTMIFFKQIRNRLSCQTLLKIASIGFAVKIAICWLGNSVFMIYVAQFIQPFAFAIFLPGMVHFTEEMMDRGEAVKGQALYTTMITATTVVASLLGGVILDASGPKMLTFIATVVTAIGALVIIFFIDKVKSNKNR